MQQMIDGHVSRVLDRNELECAIMDLIEIIGMRAVGDYVHRDTDIGPSAWQMILESHVSVHYMAEYVCIDVFSCKDFDTYASAAFCIDRFKIQTIGNLCVLQRGFG